MSQKTLKTIYHTQMNIVRRKLYKIIFYLLINDKFVHYFIRKIVIVLMYKIHSAFAIVLWELCSVYNE